VWTQDGRAQTILDRLRQAVGGACACAGFLLCVIHQYLSSCTFCTLDVSKLVAACWQLSFGSCLSSQGPGLFGVPTSLCSMPVASAQTPRGRDKKNVEFSRRRSALESARHVFWSQCALRFLAYALPGGSGVAALNRTLSGAPFSQVIAGNAKVNAAKSLRTPQRMLASAPRSLSAIY
jgi:hypothetical protein